MKDHTLPAIFTLENGLRAVINASDGNVSYIGIAVNAGSRDEPADKEGLAHFVEHTLFKGTGRRKSWHISDRMESIGGELNAYTSKEETMLYTCAPAGYEERGIELLADIVTDSRFPEKELSNERDVVIEEINSYLDSPADSVFDMYEELIYAGSSLAHNILGSPESVRSLSGNDCRQFIDRFYVPSNMTIYAVSPVDPCRIARLLEKHFSTLDHPAPDMRRVVPPIPEKFIKTVDKGGHQAHTIMGCRVFGRRDPRRHALFLLNNYLGGPCMNSRLNREIREKRGWAYAVDSQVGLLSDCGTLNIYFGTDPGMADKCAALVANEIDRLAQNRLSERSFTKIRDQYCGQLLVSSDNRESSAMALAKSVLYFGEIHTAATIAEKVREVSAEIFLDTARYVATQTFNRLTLK